MTGLLGDPRALPGLLGPGGPPTAAVPHTQPITPPAAPPPPARPLSMYERVKQGLGMLVGGPNDPSITPDQNAQAQKTAQIMAGLRMLAASYNPNGNAPGLGQILAEGVSAGQEAGAMSRAQSYAATQEERVRQALEDPNVVGNLSPQQLAMIRLLPPREAAETLAKLAFQPADAGTVVGPGAVLVGPDGKPVFTNPGATAGGPDFPTDLEAVLWQMGIDPSKMTPEQRTEAMGRYLELKRTGGTTINIGDKAAQQEFANMNTLASAYDSAIADHQKIASSYLMVRASAQDPSPAGDLSMIFAYMKMLDPTSVVREGEQASAANAAGVPDRIRAMYNRVITGERLAPEQRADFVDRARRLAEQRRIQLGPIMERYRRRASTRDLDPNQFIYDPYAEVGLDDAGPTSAYPLFEDVR